MIVTRTMTSANTGGNCHSPAENALNLTARELLNQNKQDLDVIKGSPDSRFMESFVSQRVDPKFIESFSSAAAEKTIQTKDKEPEQFKVDTTYP